MHGMVLPCFVISSVILNDLQKIHQEIDECNEKESAKQSEITELESHHSEKLQELEKLKVLKCPYQHNYQNEIASIEESIKKCNQDIADLQTQQTVEKSNMQSFFSSLFSPPDLQTLAPFLLEGNRVIAMLNGPDLLRL